MERYRPKHALRKPRRVRVLRAGIAAVAVSAVASPAVAVVWPEAEEPALEPMRTAAPVVVKPSPVPMRVAPISRSEPRVELEEKPKPPAVVDHEFATRPLNVRTRPSRKARQIDVLKRGQKVALSGKTAGEWVEIVVGKEGVWVHGDYLAEKRPKRPEPKPTQAPDPTPTSKPSPKPRPTPTAPATTSPPAPTGLSTAPCASGSAVESGLSANAVRVHRAVCAAFPSVTSYGGLRPGDSGAHGSGHALDIMVTGGTGDQIAAFARRNAGRLGISEVIWSQRIWTVQRSSEGWRWMEDRGSATANHYDHVHVTVY